VHASSIEMNSGAEHGRWVVLDAAGSTALQRYLNKGGNFAAVHSASDCMRTTGFFGSEVGELLRAPRVQFLNSEYRSEVPSSTTTRTSRVL
jgi:hypothetical protein